MEKLTDFILEYLDLPLLALIVVGGYFVTKYTEGITRIKNVHKVLIASLVFSAISYLFNDCKAECIMNYLFTYLFATSFYQVIVAFLLEKVGLKKKQNNQKNNLSHGR